MSSARDVAAAIAAVQEGRVVVFPADTVYGLAATAGTPAGRDALYALKGRPAEQPTALMARSVDALLELVPELDERVLRALLPGRYTLVLPNPAGRFPWLCGTNTGALGVRVPELDGPGRALLEGVDAVAATSANLPGEPEPRALEEVPEELRRGAAAALDGGSVPGTASTVLDLTGDEPRVLRDGAGPVDAALGALAALV